MRHRDRRDQLTCLAAALTLALLVAPLSLLAEEATATPTETLHTANKPVPAEPPSDKPHPLEAVLTFAQAERGYLQRHVQSLSCRVVKRERIEDELQAFQFVDMELEEEVRNGNSVVKPMRLFLSFLQPAEVKGRKVLFIEGANNGKMLVRKGGTRFNYAVVKIEPNSDSAMRESLLPVTDLGFGRMLDRQIEVVEKHARVDASGKNTKVQHFTDATINNRPCEVIRITHAEKQPGLEFHEANMYIDSKLRVPVRIDAWDWPEKAGDPNPLIAEYTFTELKLNPTFPEATFDADRLKQ